MTPSDRFSMSGRVALVTGGGSGFGAHFAEVLARAGATVVVAGRRKERIDAVVRRLLDGGSRAHGCVMDVTDAASVTAAFEGLGGHVGTIDVLINNAGHSEVGPFPDLGEAQWQSVMDTNVAGPWRVSRCFAQRLIAAGKPGAIVNVASITGLLAHGMFLNYGTSKAALIHLTKQMALDLLPHRIRVNALAPGYFPTDMTNWFFESDAGKAEIANLPPQRLGRLEELDGPLLLLASEASSYMNGAVIPVDYAHSVRLS